MGAKCDLCPRWFPNPYDRDSHTAIDHGSDLWAPGRLVSVDPGRERFYWCDRHRGFVLESLGEQHICVPWTEPFGVCVG